MECATRKGLRTGIFRFRQSCEKHFGCPAEFQASHNALIFSAADCGAAVYYAQRGLLGMAAPLIQVELARETIREQVKGSLWGSDRDCTTWRTD